MAEVLKYNKLRQAGFTLIELLVVVALLSVMVGIGIPAFGTLVQRNNMASVSNTFVSSLALARSEAIKRNANVSMCRSDDAGTSCVADGAWEQGWTLWLDLDGDNAIDTTPVISAEPIIKVERALPQGYTLRSTQNFFANRFVYTPSGDASGDGGTGVDVIRLCDPAADVTTARQIHVNATGRAWVDARTNVAACP